MKPFSQEDLNDKESLLELASQLLREMHHKQQRVQQQYSQSQASAQAHREILQSLPFAIFRLNQQGEINYYNQQRLSFFPKLNHHILGQSIYELFANLPHLQSQIKEALQQEAFQSKFTHRGQMYFIWYQPLYDGYGKRVNTYMLVAEVAKAEKKTLNFPKHQLFREIQTPQVALLSRAFSTERIKLDEAAQKLLNYPKAEMSLATLEALLPNGQHLPEDQNETALEWELIHEQGEVKQLKAFFLGKSEDSDFWLLQDFSPWLYQQEALRKQVNQKKHILESISEAFFTIDKNWCFSYINHKAETLLRRSRQELLGKNIWEEFDDAIGTQFYYNYHKVMEEGIPIEFEAYYPFLESWFWVRASPATYGILVIFHNISDHKETEQKLREINANKDRFFSILAHDLKNPFNNILSLVSAVETIPEEFSKEELCQMIIELSDISRRTSQLLENLLIWSRHQMKRPENQPQVLNLAEVVMPEIELVRTQGRSKNTQVNCQIAPNLKVFADQNLLNTVIRNLLNNALKFTPEQGQITVRAEEQKHKVVLSIKDNGVGMTKQDQQRIFQMEEGFAREGTAGELGTGLGLKISRELLESIGERFWCQSVLNEGSTFFFSLPKAHPKSEAAN